MLVNLIKNSIDAIDKEQARRRQLRTGGEETLEEAPAAAPEIRIVAREENERLEIELTDNGIGIEPHRMKEIFTAGHTTKGGASGLGLHSAANFVTRPAEESGRRAEVSEPERPSSSRYRWRGSGSAARACATVVFPAPKAPLSQITQPPCIRLGRRVS